MANLTLNYYMEKYFNSPPSRRDPCPTGTPVEWENPPLFFKEKGPGDELNSLDKSIHHSLFHKVVIVI
jgi:hypothetical protein